ncbi:hypothetical protein [uncultured Pseudomonas sp.]|nr:hypothetical protein [uncultured Pseudomonas sp.]
MPRTQRDSPAATMAYATSELKLPHSDSGLYRAERSGRNRIEHH